MMNSNTPHPMDEVIDRELEGLRAPVESRRGPGDAIRTMQAPPKMSGWQRFKWPIGIGSAAVIAGAAILIISFTSMNAYAGELTQIASAMKKQQTMHQKSILFGVDDKPAVIMEFWVDHERQAYRQYASNGALFIVRVFDGHLQYHYTAGNPDSGTAPWASYEKADSGDFGIQTIDSYLNGARSRKRKIEKTPGVMLDGHKCDYYVFDNGYRLWVDPATRLPLKREVLAADGTIWKRDFYDYPATFAKGIFKPFQAPGLKYIDYTEERKRLREKYGNQPQQAAGSARSKK